MSEGFPKEWLVKHPVLGLPTQAQVLTALQTEEGRAKLVSTLEERYRLICLEKEDPLRYGFEPETFKDARALLAEYDELLLSGGNREGKTMFAAKYGVEMLVNGREKIGAFFHSSESTSVALQMPVVFSFFPPELRALATRGGKTAKGKGAGESYLGYSKGAGFTNAKFILPNGSQGFFYNYKQDVGVMEGFEYDFVWFDELVPLSFLEALTFRLSRERRMKLLVTFTPVRGFSDVVGNYILGSEVLTTKRADLLPADRVLVKGCAEGEMPYTMRGGRPNSAAIFFHNGLNPYGASEEVRKKVEGAPESVVKIRAYGWADKLVTGAFGKFSRKAHVISMERWAELEKRGGRRFVSADPGGGKNWFIKWYFVTSEGWVIVYREWPDMEGHGEWALPPKTGGEEGARSDWRRGPAQKAGVGLGILGLKKLILGLEGWVWDEERGEWDGSKAEVIEERLIDPRMGAGPVPSSGEEVTSIIGLMEDEQVDAKGRVVGMPMYFEAAPASRVDETVQMLADAMDWDDGEALSVMNCPKWYVVEGCRHSILAYQEFTGMGTEKDALKDIIDPDRYFVKSGCAGWDGELKVTEGASY